VRTPAKAAACPADLAMAEAVAAEWQAQDGKVKPATMPFTRAANSAIDKVAPQFDGPEAAGRPQSAGWDPLLDWAAVGAQRTADRDGGRVFPSPAGRQPGPLARGCRGAFPVQLAAFHDLVAISGSLVLASP
jgi:chaperone required for assembly of F1-ATPase